MRSLESIKSKLESLEHDISAQKYLGENNPERYEILDGAEELLRRVIENIELSMKEIV
jgi:hypothetical protein